MGRARGLSEKIIRDARPKPKTHILWDARVRGLGVRVTPAGSKSYILNYRVAGKERRATLAPVGGMNLREARERAGAELAAIKAGEADPLERRRAVREAPTVAELWSRFETEFAPDRIAIGRMTQRTLTEYRKAARRHLLPALGQTRVADVKRSTVERMVRGMASTPSARNGLLALTSRLFSLAEVWELRPQASNPVKGVMRARVDARDRVLDDTELTALGQALDDLQEQHPVAVTAIKVAALSAWRISEVLNLRWSDISFERGVATLPETKTGRQVRPLPSAALDLLAAMPRINGVDWVFSIRRGVPTRYRHVRAVFAQAVEAAGLDDVRMHDLRRTLATRAAVSGVSLPVLRDVLGHAQITMAARYARMADAAVAAAIESSGGGVAAALRGRRG